MSNLRGCAFIGLAVLGFTASNAAASFQDIHSGARPLGMAEAFVAVADDANAALYDPAGLSQVNDIELLAMYGRLYPGLTDESDLYEGALTLTYPSRQFGTFAASWDSTALSGAYQENIFRLSYGTQFPAAWAKDLRMEPLQNLSLGLNVNLLVLSLVQNDYTALSSSISRYTQNGVSLDLGLLYALTDNCRVALAARNLLQPDMSLTSNDTNVVASEVDLGAAYVWPQLSDLLSAVTASYQAGDYRVRFGVEKWFVADTVGVRTGFGWGQGVTARDFSEYAAGASYRLKTPANRLQLDYAFTYPINGGIMGTFGNHRLSISMQW